ncbi:MAG: ATP-binding cassette domain-containing protein, partial [Verrucomicrobia bacterium]|nr:ATP-binding cassette domain-containing protein [Verrucomicrobiota bacterium]
CEVPVEPLTEAELRRRLLAEARRRGELTILAPLVRGRKGYHSEVAVWAARRGFERIRADGRFLRTDLPVRLDRYREHHIEAVVGTVRPPARGAKPDRRVEELVRHALETGKGVFYALSADGQLTVHSTEQTCPRCGLAVPPLDPKLFSYNSPAGWCPRCRGFGELFYLPENVDRGSRAEAIEESWYAWMEGEREVCPECGGSRLNPIARSVRARFGEREATIVELCRLSASELARFLRRPGFRGRSAAIARDILPEIRERLGFLIEVGLGYLQLDRSAPSLSGGEAQRIRLAAQIGSTLTGALYVLDEPTIGLHARDNERLLRILRRLQARGNSILVVEHDEATIRSAECVVDLGPGAGAAGGRVVAVGDPESLARSEVSLTGRCLREPRRHPLRGRRRPVRGEPGIPWLALEGARRFNLKDLSVRIPLGRLTLVTGVSGSGKSTLLRECLLPALEAARGGAPAPPEAGRVVEGAERIRHACEVDQSPIGRTPRSAPATYVKVFDEIRRLFSQTPEARLRGYDPGRFSFNSPQGRCPDCGGMGSVKMQMAFLPPAFVPCETCKGARFAPETLEIRYRGKNVAETLAFSVDEARAFFDRMPKIRRTLDLLAETGLGYLQLGQPSPTLSGGEAQRIKLVRRLLGSAPAQPALLDPAAKRNLFVLEEPTIGLHTADVEKLAGVLHRLVDVGHTVIVIEHNMDLIAEADWIIDLGPESGEAGGRIVVEGTPEEVARCRRSHTGRFLKQWLAPLRRSSSRSSSAA